MKRRERRLNVNDALFLNIAEDMVKCLIKSDEKICRNKVQDSINKLVCSEKYRSCFIEYVIARTADNKKHSCYEYILLLKNGIAHDDILRFIETLDNEFEAYLILTIKMIDIDLSNDGYIIVNIDEKVDE